jgi:hypothetical protein
MVRDGGLPNRKTSTQPLAANLGARRDILENLEPAWVSQRLRYPLELVRIHGIRLSLTVR